MQAGNWEPGRAEPDPRGDARGSQGSRAEEPQRLGGSRRSCSARPRARGGSWGLLSCPQPSLPSPPRPHGAPTAPHKRPHSGEAGSSALFRAGKTFPPPSGTLPGLPKGDLDPQHLNLFIFMPLAGRSPQGSGRCRRLSPMTTSLTTTHRNRGKRGQDFGGPRYRFFFNFKAQRCDSQQKARPGATQGWNISG